MRPPSGIGLGLCRDAGGERSGAGSPRVSTKEAGGSLALGRTRRKDAQAKTRPHESEICVLQTFSWTAGQILRTPQRNSA